MGPSGHDYRVEQVVADLLPEPVQVSHVIVIHVRAQLHLYCHHAPCVTCNDQVNLLSSSVGSQVVERCFRSLCFHTDIERHERLEQSAQESAVARRQGQSSSFGRGCLEQGVCVETKQAGRERGIYQLIWPGPPELKKEIVIY